jgi:DNA invertase Pin-like site-specific DNA recombinase
MNLHRNTNFRSGLGSGLLFVLHSYRIDLLFLTLHHSTTTTHNTQHTTTIMASRAQKLYNDIYDAHLQQLRQRVHEELNEMLEDGRVRGTFLLYYDEDKDIPYLEEVQSAMIASLRADGFTVSISESGPPTLHIALDAVRAARASPPAAPAAGRSIWADAKPAAKP